MNPTLDKTNRYTVRIASRFILTPSAVKSALGMGFKVESVELDRDVPTAEIVDVDSAVLQIIQTGYRALARAHHPDFGGSTEKMVILNRAKKELDDLMKEIGG